jgi:hypothetical protein
MVPSRKRVRFSDDTIDKFADSKESKKERRIRKAMEEELQELMLIIKEKEAEAGGRAYGAEIAVQLISDSITKAKLWMAEAEEAKIKAEAMEAAAEAKAKEEITRAETAVTEAQKRAAEAMRAKAETIRTRVASAKDAVAKAAAGLANAEAQLELVKDIPARTHAALIKIEEARASAEEKEEKAAESDIGEEATMVMALAEEIEREYRRATQADYRATVGESEARVGAALAKSLAREVYKIGAEETAAVHVMCMTEIKYDNPILNDNSESEGQLLKEAFRVGGSDLVDALISEGTKCSPDDPNVYKYISSVTGEILFSFNIASGIGSAPTTASFQASALTESSQKHWSVNIMQLIQDMAEKTLPEFQTSSQVAVLSFLFELLDYAGSADPFVYIYIGKPEDPDDFGSFSLGRSDVDGNDGLIQPFNVSLEVNVSFAGDITD